MSDWISDYIEYTSAQESPTIFHRWCAIGAIASALSRKVYLPRTSKFGVEFFRTWPGQISIVLVAGAGRCKKSTAVNLISDVMELSGGINIYDGKITPEQLLHKMSALPFPRLTIVAEELSAFLTKTSYNDGLVDILNKLIDGSNNPYETRAKQIKLASPALTMNCATTPTNLAKAILPQAIGHGYSSRQIYVYSEDPGAPEPLFYSEPPDSVVVKEYEELKTSLVIRLGNYCSYSGLFKITKETENWYDNWYREYKKSSLSEEEGWPQRLPDHLIRIASVLAVSRGEQNLTYATKDLDSASLLLEDVNSDLHKVFTHVGQHVNADRHEKVLRVFKEKAARTGVKRAVVDSDELYQKCIRYYPNPNEFQQDIAALRGAGIIDSAGKDARTGKIQYVMLKELT